MDVCITGCTTVDYNVVFKLLHETIYDNHSKKTFTLYIGSTVELEKNELIKFMVPGGWYTMKIKKIGDSGDNFVYSVDVNIF